MLLFVSSINLSRKFMFYHLLFDLTIINIIHLVIMIPITKSTIAMTFIITFITARVKIIVIKCC